MTIPVQETQIVICEKCGGAGEYDTQHPMWGSRSCPEPYISVTCADCEGTGEVEVEVDDEAKDDRSTGDALRTPGGEGRG